MDYPLAGKKYRGFLLVWPLIFSILTASVWLCTYLKIESEKKASLDEAKSHAVSISKAYSEQLARTIQEIDLLLLNAKYDWEHYRGRLDLMDQAQKGLYPPSSAFTLTLVNSAGVAISSTAGNKYIDVKDREFFRVHKESKIGLFIGTPEPVSRRTGKNVIRFSRRLETSTGNFAGVIFVSVDSAFLATFNDEASMNPGDFISVRHINGTLLESERGNDIKNGQVHRSAPIFTSAVGVVQMRASMYKDNAARILAWNKLPGYPLVSYVGLSVPDILDAREDTISTYRHVAALATGLFLILSAVSLFYSSRWAKRKIRAEGVSATYRLAIDDAREGFFMVRALYGTGGQVENFLIEDCNERGAAFVGKSRESMLGTTISQTPLLQNFRDSLPSYKRALQSGFCDEEVELQNLVPNQPQWIQRRMVRSDFGLAVTIRDISDVKAHAILLQKLADTDGLTGLPNRNWVMNHLRDASRKASENNSMFAVMFLDLDKFKNVNDSLGHAIGDELLALVANRLKNLLRPEDVVARIGGDEFTVALRSANDIAEVEVVAKRITQTIDRDFYIQGKTISIGVSIGISLCPKDGVDADSLMQKADIAMYASKDEGRNTFRFYNHKLYDRIRTRMNAEDELVRAISLDQFDLYYQPRFNTSTHEATGLEALLRWNHPARGIVSPLEFIELAEQCGCIVPLGELVIKKVCKQLHKWIAEGKGVLPVSVNVSPWQLEDGKVDETIFKLIQRYAIPAGLIEVELTESAMMSHSNNIIRQVSAMRKLGIKLHIDDFGTGFSSLSRLQEIDMQVLKIDRSFTSRLGTSKRADELVKTIISMARALDMSCIAEGVETEGQLAILKSMGCEEVQGYFFSKPLRSDNDLLRQILTTSTPQIPDNLIKATIG